MLRACAPDPGAHALRALSPDRVMVDGRGQVVPFAAGPRPRLPVQVYVPARLSSDPRVLVSVHGVSRNADEHIELFRHLADCYGVVLIAPRFAADDFRDYQRLGRERFGPRADLALIRVLNEIGARTGWNTAKVDLFGFSGGAQFAHRFALAHPQRVRRLMLGAAGWYTMPDAKQTYPRGIADAAGLSATRLNATAMAQLPTLVLVGAEDDKIDDVELNRSKKICRQQGNSRLERARNWVAMMRAFAVQRGVVCDVELVELPGVDHSFRQAVLRGGLATRVYEYCYG